MNHVPNIKQSIAANITKQNVEREKEAGGEREQVRGPDSDN